MAKCAYCTEEYMGSFLVYLPSIDRSVCNSCHELYHRVPNSTNNFDIWRRSLATLGQIGTVPKCGICYTCLKPNPEGIYLLYNNDSQLVDRRSPQDNADFGEYKILCNTCRMSLYKTECKDRIRHILTNPKRKRSVPDLKTSPPSKILASRLKCCEIA
jgi:hypothetical protein